MLPKERIYKAISGDTPDRVPSIPKIWVDLATNLTNTDLMKVIEDPLTALQVIIDAALMIGADGARQFHFPKRKIISENDRVFEIDKKGNYFGEIDMMGGLMTRLNNASNFKLENPNQMAFHHYWICDKEPIIKKLSDVKRITIPNKSFYEEIGCGKRQRKMIKWAGDRICLIGDCDSATLAFYVNLRGYNNAMIDLIEQPKLIHATMDKGVAIAVEKGKFNIDLGLKILRLNDSVANMSVISPAHWREFILPHMKDVCDELHHYDPKVKIYCHICGNILPIVESLIETGLDCIGPLDPLGGFTPGQVREIVGERVSLMGGVNTLSFINNTPKQIIEEAKRCMLEAGKKGGYILSSGCVIPRGASKENLNALRIATEKYGVYHKGILNDKRKN
jgi:uroporphyrinogen-III decarboxylase